MQNTAFLALLRLIFALKTKIAPPLELAMRIGLEPDVNLTRKTGLQSGWGPFFWRSPKFGQKNQPNLSEDLFFGDHLNLDRKTNLI